MVEPELFFWGISKIKSEMRSSKNGQGSILPFTGKSFIKSNTDTKGHFHSIFGVVVIVTLCPHKQ